MALGDDDAALLVAERCITRVLHRYAQGIDRHRMDRVRECYWDDATDSHAPLFSGDVDDYVRWLSEVLPRVERISHQFTNILITADPPAGTATVESYCLNMVLPRTLGDVAPRNQLQCLRYLDRFERRGGEWRILRREVLRDWSWVLGPPAAGTGPLDATGQ